MKKQLLTAGFLSLFMVVSAQEKSDLSQVPNLLSEPLAIETADEWSLFTNNNFTLEGNYTLEVKAKVTEVDKRGMDIEAKSALGEGFRMVIAPDCFLDASKTFEYVTLQKNMDNTSSNTFRFMMLDNQLQIFRNENLLAKTDKVILEGLNLINANDAQFNEGNFDGGVFEGWTAGGVGEKVEIVDIPTTSPASTQEANRCLHVEFPAKLNGVDVASTMVLGLEAGKIYDFNYRFLPYLRNAPGGGNNITIGVYADQASLASLGASWHNGYSYAAGDETDPVWMRGTIRFTMPEELDYAFIRIIARNNPCNIYFDDLSITKVEYPTDFPEFKDIPEGEANNRENNTGIYNKTNLWWDYDPGFEYAAANGNANTAEDGTALPKEQFRWFSNGGLTGPAGARVLDISESKGYAADAEGAKVFMARFDYTYKYFSLIMPKDRMKPNTAYRVRFRIHAFKAPSNNKSIYFRVGDNVNGTSGHIFNSMIATLPEYIEDDSETADVDEMTRGDKYVTLAFYTPDVLPENMYASILIKDSGDILFGVDEFTLVEAAAAYTPNGQITIGKNFFAGSANMEIQSVKYAPEAYYPANYVNTNIQHVNDGQHVITYSNGILKVKNMTGNTIRLYNMAGTQIFNASISAVDASYQISLPAGIYVCKSGQHVSKFIVE